MTTTTIDITSVEPIGHREGCDLAEADYAKFASLLERLRPDDWTAQTDCPGWSVRDMAGHVVGAMRSAASIRELLRQQKQIKRRAKADGGNEVDHMTALQIELTAGLSVEELVRECRDLVGPAAKGRLRTPAPMRRFVKIPVVMGPIDEVWTLGHLLDVILTRDTFMHRIDISRATGADADIDGEHDARIIAAIVADWSERHGRPFDLHLTGPGGGRYVSPAVGDREQISIDAVEFCRTVSGREAGTGLLAVPVPF